MVVFDFVLLLPWLFHRYDSPSDIVGQLIPDRHR